jgi:hypothetical protein
MQTNLILTTPYKVSEQHPYSVDENTEVQQRDVTCLVHLEYGKAKISIQVV